MRGVFVSFAYVMVSCMSWRLSLTVRPGMHPVWSVCIMKGSTVVRRFESALVRTL